MYEKRLPTVQEITHLSTLIRSYPVNRAEVLRTARLWDLKYELIAFIREFPPNAVFQTRIEFVSQSNKLAASIRELWEAPAQFTLKF